MSDAPCLDGPVTLAQLEAGVWARAERVAIALGVDERTIRRRVRSGTLERGTFAGRVYVRQVSRPAPEAAPDSAGQPASTLSTSAAHQLEALLAAAVREHVARVEHLAAELGQTRARLEHVQAVATAQLDASAARRQAAEHELANERQRAAVNERQADTLREQTAAFIAQVEHELADERQRRTRLEELARAPWYAVRVRRRLRRELLSSPVS